MKPVHIEFVKDESWRLIWGITAIVVTVIVVVTAWHVGRAEKATRAARAQIAQLQAEIENARKPKDPPKDPRKESLARVFKLLSYDWNKPFAVIERLEVTGATLKATTIDSGSDTIRLEYEVASLSIASEVTDALNAGYPASPWQLESVSASRNASPVGGQSQQMRGSWRAKLSAL